MIIQEGKAASAFTLPDAKGKKVALKDFEKGRYDPLFLSQGQHIRLDEIKPYEL
ncbi:MAG: hypothetical protein JRJ09_13320 [Deltaproteobacteria bacterium]|nr:hypothetical protein [Deltaproteobacteria bacterium]MBW2049488.1 hypothetical protein [Deltaproteobacteria bacterium]MBW2111170.1 hypothetical protein [Deltaproteobacteria bacterium]MBW2353625.1 hypothetical protein [Deltaproteobacteria bacterium]